MCDSIYILDHKFKYAIILLLLQMSMISASGQIIMSVKNTPGESGQTIFVDIEVVNSLPFVAFQFDLAYSASVFSFDKSLSALTDRKDGHSLSLSEPVAGMVRAISFSSSQKSFTGNSGAVIRLAFLCSAQDYGEFLFELSNAIIANSQSQNILNQMINGFVTVGKTQTITLNQGWSWFSVNINSGSWRIADVMQSVVPKAGDYIKNQTISATYYEGFGWFGELEELDPRTMYKVKLGSAATLTIFGTPVDPSDYPIAIKQGWTWIGYLPQSPMLIQQALSSINPGGNDYLKNQTVSTMYYVGSGWFGELIQLKSGDGYMLKCGHVAILNYDSP